MYTPPHFHLVNPAQIDQLVAAHPLAALVAHTSGGLIANHIPMLLAPSRGQGANPRLIGHIALANDLHRLLPNGSQVMAIFRGFDAYISPNFYPSKAQHHRHVPTWNYEVVHIHGTIEFSHDIAQKRAAVGLLTRQHERALHGDAGWRMTDAPADYLDDMLGKIVAFQIDCAAILAKSKLSQNRETVDLLGAADGLDALGHFAIAERMRQTRAFD